MQIVEGIGRKGDLNVWRMMWERRLQRVGGKNKLFTRYNHSLVSEPGQLWHGELWSACSMSQRHSLNDPVVQVASFTPDSELVVFNQYIYWECFHKEQHSLPSPADCILHCHINLLYFTENYKKPLWILRTFAVTKKFGKICEVPTNTYTKYLIQQ